MPISNKVCFTAKEIYNTKNVVVLKKYKGHEMIGDIYSDRWGYRADFDIIKWLNSLNN